MNEFNPFTTLGIDPNKDWENKGPTLRVDSSVSTQFNPFTTLGINPNETNTEIEQPTGLQIYDNSKDKEVVSKLGVDLNRMSDPEKQSYVDSLSDEDRNIWNNLKNEGYSFEARKALLENQDMLYDISKKGTGKYLQDQNIEPITSIGAQRYIDWYQQRVYGKADQLENRMYEKINYKKNGEERTGKGSGVLKAVGNTLAGIGGGVAQLVEDLLGLEAHGLEAFNNIRYLKGKTDQLATIDRTSPSYESMEKSILEVAKDLTGLGVNIERAIPSAIFQALGSGDGPVAKIVNFMGEVWDDLISVVPNLSVNTVHNALMKNEKIRERLEAPENEGMQESMIELLTNVEMAILGKRMKGKGEKVGKTKASMIYNDVKGKIRTDVYGFSERLKSGIKTANEAADWMKQYNRTEGIEGTSMGRSNVRQATIEGFKKGFNELKESKPTEEIIKEGKIESKEITPYEQERQRQIQERKTSIVNQTKDLKISEESKTNLANNPNLQTAYTEVLKPYLEENGSNNPEGLITQQVDELVYDIRAGIDELFVQQANLTRKVGGTQKLSPMEKALIKEIQKIISNKEPKTVLKKLSKLTPAQQGIMEKIVPNLTQRITTITQLETLLNEIIKGNLIGKILKFQANRPRVTLRGALKKQVYKYISDYWDQRGIKHTIEDIDNFVSKLSEAEINDIAKGENLSESPLATKIEEGGKALGVIKAEGSEIDLYENERLKGEGYTPDTNLYTTDESGKIVEHDILNELDTKPANGGKTIREIFKEAGVNLTLPNKWIYDIRFSRGRNIAGIYYDGMDLIALPKQSAQVGVLMHEFGHRLWKQFGEDQMLKITEEIERRTGLTGKEANERFAEYMRNYFLYGNIDGKLSKDMIKDMGKDLGQKVFNQMEKTRNELLDVFGAPNNRYITETIDSVFKLTDKGKKLVQTEVESDVGQMQNFLQKNISTLEQYSESPLKVSGNNIVKQLKEQAFSDIKKIRIDEEGNVMGQYHSHEGPIASLMENRDEINLDKEVKTFLEKQAEEWENKKFEQSLENLKD